MASCVSPLLRSSFRICSPLTMPSHRCRATPRTPHRKCGTQRRHVHQTATRYGEKKICIRARRSARTGRLPSPSSLECPGSAPRRAGRRAHRHVPEDGWLTAAFTVHCAEGRALLEGVTRHPPRLPHTATESNMAACLSDGDDSDGSFAERTVHLRAGSLKWTIRTDFWLGVVFWFRTCLTGDFVWYDKC